MPLSEEDIHHNPEIADIMKRVREMARKHTSTFHCGSGAEEAIRDAGLDKYDADKSVKVRVDFSIAGVEGDQSVEYEFDKLDLHGKTHEEQCAWVGEAMSPALVFGDTNFEVNIPITVKDLNKVIPPPPRLEQGLAFHKLVNGRVGHIVNPRGRDLLCGDAYFGGFGRPNGADPGDSVCKKCRKRALTQYGVETGDVV
jgi:hypothetical protein